MDEGVSTAAVEVLVQNLINVFKEEYFQIRDLEGDAKQLQTTLRMIQGYLNDAEKKSITQEAVKIWLRELQALAFDADTVLDEFSYHLLHNEGEKMKTPKHKVLSCFSSFNNHIARPRNMALRIKQINATFESMNKRATELGLQEIVLHAPAIASSHASFESNSFTLDPIFVGRDDDVPKLVDVLTVLCEKVEERVFSIIAIVGMGGMGKTTLTRKVFSHEKMKNRFGSLIWVHVSQTFDPIILFKKILSMLTSCGGGGGDGVESREVILKHLQEALEDKTYLLVLDDVWNEDVPKWEEFINSMSGVTSTKGNGIIMTTRKANVASIARPLLIHSLNGLSDEECWSIVKAKTFENGDVVPSGFEMIGRKIAKRCRGLPLAANVVGGVLRCKTEEEWHSINENWLSDGEGGENISKILRLSFDHLPSPSLKKCFAYCSIFQKGEQIKSQELIELWMAERYLQDDERNEMEHVGKKFLNILLHNSLLQVSWRDDYGNIRTCVMHDLVHDLATRVLGNDSNGLNLTRYTIIHENKPNPILKESAKYTRTLFFEGNISATIFSDFECLHVLTLQNYGVEEFPSSIRKLIHLRNLDISKTTIKNLPGWIGELHHLQTLRVNSGCRLTKLPSTLKYLINLRHLYINSRVELPAGIGRLTCLQTLSHFTVGDKNGCRIEELGSLKNLTGKLVIRNLEKVHDNEEALKANISEKPNLFDLRFEWNGGGEGDESVLEGLQPHTNLKALEIAGFKGKRYPSWTMKMAVGHGPQGSWAPLSKLIELTLSMCPECEDIPMMEHLPNLKSLCLRGLKKVRFINSSFSKLKSLSIQDLEGLECFPDWLFYENQNLSHFTIHKCPKLRELPDGLHTLKSLNKLYVYGCPHLKSIGNPPSGQAQSHGVLRTLTIGQCGGLMELPCEMVELWRSSLEILSLEELSSLNNLSAIIDCLAKSARLRDLTIRNVPILMMANCNVESWHFGSLCCLEMDVSKVWSRESDTAIKETLDAILQGCSSSFTRLELTGVENWESLPRPIQHLTALSFLKLKNFGLEELPEWFGNLTSLRNFKLQSCKKLRRLLSRNASEHLTKLKYLLIDDCPELHIDREQWRKLPHLHIQVDSKKIHM